MVKLEVSYTLTGILGPRKVKIEAPDNWTDKQVRQLIQEAINDSGVKIDGKIPKLKEVNLIVQAK
jgi:hypothetical protein